LLTIISVSCSKLVALTSQIHLRARLVPAPCHQSSDALLTTQQRWRPTSLRLCKIWDSSVLFDKAPFRISLIGTNVERVGSYWVEDEKMKRSTKEARSIKDFLLCSPIHSGIVELL
jgi:hypothetical protein